MNINWGYRIAFVYIGFVALILTLVFMTMGQKVELLYTDYYDKELKYQETLDGKANLNKLEGNVSITQNQGQLQIELPETFKNKSLKGELTLIRPSDSRLDRKFPLTEASTSINSKQLLKGLYLLQVVLEMDKIPYYYEQSITIE